MRAARRKRSGRRLFQFDRELGFRYVAGADEAGRGCLAGPLVAAAVLFAGSFVPRRMFEEARRVTVPLQVLLQWDDEGNDRQAALDLFDALGSREKTLHANLGGHTGVPAYELDAAARVALGMAEERFALTVVGVLALRAAEG